jgi:hypothetical protein
VIHIPSLQIDEVGVDAMKTLVAVPRTVSPDILATINDQVAEGDKVVTSWTARGTLAGEMRGVDSEDDEVRASGVSIHHIYGGSIEETWWQINARVDEPHRPPHNRIREQVLRRFLETPNRYRRKFCGIGAATGLQYVARRSVAMLSGMG